ncbi:NmrA family NAD(P)-binding protein [Streptomyces phaeochromogenes]|uniref:NmrA family NAD(P)-binding protein n=1 Tax=Streptomyces phaeochromogenes TaxID=1923 RepID=UPI002DDC7EEE|nr:NAD(P)H-binding protein [Streptomyces phaeochromogenes]WRZ28439.1 NAD(P)H-binding protein [Streptomyces phaeochromogenes]WSJ09043.1 NAD(P)H-binding protein [Streptomyces phaeochromogenes]
MTENTRNETVLVTGASGKTGRQVAESAKAAGFDVRAASRSSEVRFDWYDSSTWAEALRGADAAYLAYTPDIGAPGAAENIAALARLAQELGVRRLVMLSARGERQAEPAERALRESGAEWTVVQADWFFQNFSEGLLLEGVQSGEFVFPAGEVKVPFIDTRDLADVVVKALTDPSYAGRTLEITGARLLSFREAMAEITAAAGREIRYVPVPTKEYGAILAGFGLPPEEVAFMEEVFDGLLDGGNARSTETVRQVLGRAPRDFTDFARELAATGVWKV